MIKFQPRSLRSIAGPLAAMFLFAATAQAQHRTSTEKAAAESLFDHAMQHLKAGNLEAACENFEKSQKIDPAVGTLLYLAECYERTGRTASAWATFREAASLARELRESDRAIIGDQRAARLESQLARVTIDTVKVQAISDVTLLQDGVPLNPALFGASVPIDPGTHTLVVQAPGYETWKQEFVIAAGTQSTTIEVPALVAKPSPPAEPDAGVASVAPQPSPQPPPLPPAVPPQVREADHTLSLVLMGGGLAFVGAGVGFGVHAKNLDDRAAKDCDRTRCATTNAEALSDGAQQAALFSNIGYGVGAAAIILGGVLFILDTNEQDAEKIAAFRLAPTTTGGHLWYQGTF